MRKQVYKGSVLRFIAVMVTNLFSLTMFASADTNCDYVMWYDKPADGYGLKSPLESWKVENPNRTHKPHPDQAWSTGLVKGLRARGGFIVDIAWKNAQLVKTTIKATKAAKLTVCWNDKTWKRELVAGQTITLSVVHK